MLADNATVPLSVDLTFKALANNTTMAALAGDLQGAIDAELARLGRPAGLVSVSVSGDRLQIAAADDRVTSITVRNGTALGFGPDQSVGALR